MDGELENQMSQLVDKNFINEMLKMQLLEFEMLQSMFPNPGELCLDDSSILSHFNNYLDGKTSLIPNQLDFSVNLKLDSNKLEVCVNLPSEYPHFEPDIFVRSDNLNRVQQSLLNTDLTNYISSLDRGDICIGSAITWLQENGLAYFDKSDLADFGDEPQLEKNTNSFSRFWIYSHHIYSKVKRREIIDLAHEYHLTGFSLPGRPGIICIEGLFTDCEDWWLKIKSLNWKKIMIKKKEEVEADDVNINELRRFKTFEEIYFDPKGKKGNIIWILVNFINIYVNTTVNIYLKTILGLKGNNFKYLL